MLLQPLTVQLEKLHTCDPIGISRCSALAQADVFPTTQSSKYKTFIRDTGLGLRGNIQVSVLENNPPRQSNEPWVVQVAPNTGLSIDRTIRSVLENPLGRRDLHKTHQGAVKCHEKPPQDDRRPVSAKSRETWSTKAKRKPLND